MIDALPNRPVSRDDLEDWRTRNDLQVERLAMLKDTVGVFRNIVSVLVGLDDQYLVLVFDDDVGGWKAIYVEDHLDADRVDALVETWIDQRDDDDVAWVGVDRRGGGPF